MVNLEDLALNENQGSVGLRILASIQCLVLAMPMHITALICMVITVGGNPHCPQCTYHNGSMYRLYREVTVHTKRLHMYLIGKQLYWWPCILNYIGATESLSQTLEVC